MGVMVVLIGIASTATAALIVCLIVREFFDETK